VAKKINNPKEVKIVEENGAITVSLHYGLGCDEYSELGIRKGLSIETLTPPEQETAADIMAWATNKMKEHEGIS